MSHPEKQRYLRFGFGVCFCFLQKAGGRQGKSKPKGENAGVCAGKHGVPCQSFTAGCLFYSPGGETLFAKACSPGLQNHRRPALCVQPKKRRISRAKSRPKRAHAQPGLQNHRRPAPCARPQSAEQAEPNPGPKKGACATRPLGRKGQTYPQFAPAFAV